MRDQIFDLQRRYGSLAAYANKITRTERSESGEDVEREIPFLKGYTVFNVEQIDGLPDHYYAQPAPRFDPITRIEHPEFFFRATGGDIRCGGGRAFYSPSVPNATGDMLKIAAVAMYRPATLGLACDKV